MKKASFLRRFGPLALGSLALWVPPRNVHASSILDIGTDYRLRAIAFGRSNYGQDSGQDYTYFAERATAHVGGRFSPNIEMMTQIQALGLVGSSNTYVNNGAVNPSGHRYPNTNFTPFIQTAYLKASNLYDLPLDVTIGRQPMVLGDGLILSDDDLGFTGVRLQSRLPWYGMRADLFEFRQGDSFISSNSNDIFGLELTKPFDQVRIQASVVTERDATGSTLYFRPSENISTGTLATTDLTASRITRTFYDGRVEGRLLEGGFYKGEFALQSGNVNRSSSTLGSVQLGGYAFLISGGLFTHTSKYGPIEIHGTFGMASGDSGSGKDDSFRPTYGHQFDGTERSGFGEFYGATLYNALPSSGSINGLPPGYSGIRVIGAGVTTHPTALLSIGIDYYVFTAQETPTSAFTFSSTDSSLGTEIDVGLGFAYTSYLSFRASFALFQPGAAYEFQSNATRFLLEATGRF
ncbi:MAG TPA: alginate export family protein [Elusimicrobiota bacterium]|nr:alginate export family protein [Elusimicrobiota bacterium]